MHPIAPDDPYFDRLHRMVHPQGGRAANGADILPSRAAAPSPMSRDAAHGASDAAATGVVSYPSRGEGGPDPRRRHRA